jgi:colanic acid biosynthesis glycosyl transferase WcaI
VNRANLRVTIVGLNYAPEPTGNAPYTSSLAEGLVDAGHVVHVVTGYPHYPEWNLKPGYSGWSRTEVIRGVHVQRLRHHVPRKPTALSRLHLELSFGIRLLFARWNRPDVVLVVSPALFSSAMAILRIRLSPNRPAAGIWVQDLYSRGVVETRTGGGSAARFAAQVESRVLRATDGVAAIHERFKDFIVKGLGVPAGKVKVIRNWTHLPASPTEGAAEMRTQLGWDPSDIVVLHAGNMGKKQGLENVVAAARLAETQGSKVRFVLMGDGNQRQRLELMSSGLSQISFLDPLPGSEFQRALAAANVLLVNELPGVKDMAVPSKLTSYFNAGVPVIAATDEGSVTASEISRSGGGIRVDAGNPGALVETAEILGQDTVRAAKLGSQGLRFREETLSAAAALSDYDEFITSLASSRGR